jgi:hypothetical protein
VSGVARGGRRTRPGRAAERAGDRALAAAGSRPAEPEIAEELFVALDTSQDAHLAPPGDARRDQPHRSHGPCARAWPARRCRRASENRPVLIDTHGTPHRLGDRVHQRTHVRAIERGSQARRGCPWSLERSPAGARQDGYLQATLDRVPTMSADFGREPSDGPWTCRILFTGGPSSRRSAVVPERQPAAWGGAGQASFSFFRHRFSVPPRSSLPANIRRHMAKTARVAALADLHRRTIA